jgi:hypothetical protein
MSWISSRLPALFLLTATVYFGLPRLSGHGLNQYHEIPKFASRESGPWWTVISSRARTRTAI